MHEKLSYIVHFYRDVNQARQWYEKAGFAYSHGDGERHWFRLGEGLVMLHPTSEEVTPGVSEIHIQVSDVDALFQAVVAAGLEPLDFHTQGPLTAPLTRPWGAREFNLYDPEGHRWAFIQWS